METPSKDLRVRRTYKALSEALLSLLQEKGLREITVNEICERAMVRRATFYTHFADKQALFIFTFRETMGVFSKKAREMLSSSEEDFFYEINLLLLDYMEANAAMFSSDRDSDAYLTAWDLLTCAAAEEFSAYLGRLPENQLAGPPEVVSQLLAGATVQGVRWWLSHQSLVGKHAMAEHLQQFIIQALGLCM